MPELSLAFWIVGLFALVMLGVILWFARMEGIYSPVLPNLLTIIGILGTFVGIVVGLLDFDVGNVQESIPRLLDGLKTAFFTSVIGLVLSVIFRLRNYNHAHMSSEPSDGADVDDMIRAAVKTANMQDAQLAATKEGFEYLANRLTGGDDSTLLTQLKNMRTDIRDGLGEVVTQFRTFAEQMTKINQEALIEALTNVIQDFNQQLTEQFGENFVHLNYAVEKLVDWQDKYREIVEETVARIDRAVQATEASRDALAEIRKDFQSVTELSGRLKQILEAFVAHEEALSSQLDTFSTLVGQVREDLPRLEERLSNLTSEFQRSVTESLAQVNRAVEANSDQSQSIVVAAGNVVDSVSETSRTLTNEVNQTLDHTRSQIEQAITASRAWLTDLAANSEETIREVVSRAQDQLGDELRDMTSKHISRVDAASDAISNNMNENIEKLDAALQHELRNSLNSLGTQLAALSGRFVEDYGPLTEQLRNVVHLSEEIRRDAR